MKPEESSGRKRVVWQDITPAKPVVKSVTKQKQKHKFKFIISKFPSRQVLKVLTNIRQYVTKSKQRKLVFVLSIFVVAIIISINCIQRNNNQTPLSATDYSGTNSPVNTSGKLVPGAPTYAAILPTGKSLKDLGGGWVRNDKQPSFIYVDKIGTTQINVSEQPLPDSFKENPAHEVEALATSFNATQKISLGNNTIYIGSYDQGIQRVVFMKNNLLVLITSSANITASQWATYVNSLN
jgi:hypothetical protein